MRRVVTVFDNVVNHDPAVHGGAVNLVDLGVKWSAPKAKQIKILCVAPVGDVESGSAVHKHMKVFCLSHEIWVQMGLSADGILKKAPAVIAPTFSRFKHLGNSDFSREKGRVS